MARNDSLFYRRWNEAASLLELGFHISFSGIVTFRNADAICDAAKQVPDDRVLVETDAPFLRPSRIAAKQMSHHSSSTRALLWRDCGERRWRNFPNKLPGTSICLFRSES